MKNVSLILILLFSGVYLSAQGYEIGKYSSVGEIPMLVLLVDFSDEQFRSSQNVAWIDNLLFSETGLNTTDYFYENSEGIFSFVKSRIVGPLRYSDPAQPPGIDDASRWCAFNTKDPVSGEPRCPGTLSDEYSARRRVIQIAYEAGVDFNIYDRNRDGKINLDRGQGPMELLILWIEGSPANGGAVRTVNIGMDCFQPDQVDGLPRQPRLCGGVAGMGDEAGFDGIMHEISHTLKTIDLYQAWETSRNSLLSTPSGTMRHLDPWHKMLLGWITPEILESGVDFSPGRRRTITLNSSQDRPSTHHAAVLLANPAYRGKEEFFLLEYRSNTLASGREYDAGVSTSGGLVIWQVNNWNPPGFNVQPRNFAYAAGGWRKDRHVRRVADINGDGIGDLVGFGEEDVFVMQGEKNEMMHPRGIQFGPLVKVIKNFSLKAGRWETDKHVRVLADVTGDGKDDIIGFGQKDVFVSVSTSLVSTPRFSSPQVWLGNNFSYERGGWRVDKHVRKVADVNGDGKADLIGFGQKEVFVSLAHSSQNRFLPPQVWLGNNFSYERGGWRVDKHVREVADVNGDGRADLIGFGQKDVWVSLAHPTQNRFLPAHVWLRGDFSYEGGNWRVNRHVREVADVNGDGRADLVGFGQKHVFVSLAHRTQNRFLPPQIWLKDMFSYEGGGWRVGKHIRTVADVDNDGNADLVGFGEYGVDVRIADPTNSNTSIRFSKDEVIMRKVFSIAPHATRRSNGNKMGLYGENQAFTRTDGRIELKWLNGRPAFTVEVLGSPRGSALTVRVEPNRQ